MSCCYCSSYKIHDLVTLECCIPLIVADEPVHLKPGSRPTSDDSVSAFSINGRIVLLTLDVLCMSLTVTNMCIRVTLFMDALVVVCLFLLILREVDPVGLTWEYLGHASIQQLSIRIIDERLSHVVTLTQLTALEAWIHPLNARPSLTSPMGVLRISDATIPSVLVDIGNNSC
ncbi:hypothetical protein A0H81_07298 [Grifola frondosa]|uniref:Uncharacterized protein n=1 Tax=Grifola frondosa TaxID=5627 RepID=A0A1C7MAT9_GRIFR|nr:hypothetical protein A0H81_07298 [Grifola frondosa]